MRIGCFFFRTSYMVTHTHTHTKIMRELIDEGAFTMRVYAMMREREVFCFLEWKGIWLTLKDIVFFFAHRLSLSLSPFSLRLFLNTPKKKVRLGYAREVLYQCESCSTDHWLW